MSDEKDPSWVEQNADGSVGFVPSDRQERQKNTSSSYRENYDRIFGKKSKEPEVEEEPVEKPEEITIEMYSDESCANAINNFQEKLKDADNYKGGDFKEFWLAMRKEGPNILNVSKHLFTLHLRNTK